MPVLIESKWNVNAKEVVTEYLDGSVLIESKWNVNKFAGWIQGAQGAVLIESKWNVNVIHTDLPLRGS